MARLVATPGRKRLVPRTALVALIALLGLLVAAPADAQRARHVTINVEDTLYTTTPRPAARPWWSRWRARSM